MIDVYHYKNAKHCAKTSVYKSFIISIITAIIVISYNVLIIDHGSTENNYSNVSMKLMILSGDIFAILYEYEIVFYALIFGFCVSISFFFIKHMCPNCSNQWTFVHKKNIILSDYKKQEKLINFTSQAFYIRVVEYLKEYHCIKCNFTKIFKSKLISLIRDTKSS